MKATIGIDPGTSGGLSLWLDGALVHCAHVAMAQERAVTGAAYCCIGQIPHDVPVTIAYEATKVHGSPGDPTKGALIAGRVLQALERELREQRFTLEAVIPATSDAWRKALYGYCRIEGGRAAWKALAIRWCDEHCYGWRSMSDVRAQKKLEDVAEAICIGASIWRAS